MKKEIIIFAFLFALFIIPFAYASEETVRVYLPGATFTDGKVLPQLNENVIGIPTSRTLPFIGLCVHADFSSGPDSVCQALSGGFTRSAGFSCQYYANRACALRSSGTWGYFDLDYLPGGGSANYGGTGSGSCWPKNSYLEWVDCVRTVPDTQEGTTPAPSPAITPSAEINTCLYANQTIFSMYSANNSHAAVFNSTFQDSNAKYSVCYEQVFGEEYKGSSNPWECKGDNLVLKLSSEKNAHAENPSGTIYENQVCYGDLKCTLRESTSCLSNEVEIARLSDETNAHVAEAGFNSYAFALCCSEKQPGFNNAFWKDKFNERTITNTIMGDLVTLEVDTNFTAGTSISFEIRRSMSFIGSLKVNDTLSAITNSEGKASVSWTVGEGDNGIANRDYWFIARAQGFSITSTQIPVGQAVVGSACLVNTRKLQHGGVYFVNTDVELNHTRVGEGWNVEWKISEDNLVLRNDSITYRPITAGQKTITLIARNSHITGCAEQQEQIAILVINSPGMLLFVDRPFHGEAFAFGSDSNISIPYNASGMYVINSSAVSGQVCARNIVCLAGKCPSRTINAPSGCAQPITITGTPQPLTSVNLTWNKINRNGQKQTTPFASGAGIVLGNIQYQKGGSSNLFKSDKPNDLSIIVLANYTNNVQGISIQQQFTRNFTVGECLDNKKAFAYIRNGRIEQIVKTTSEISSVITNNYDSAACAGRDGSANTNDDCCPAGYECKTGQGCVLRTDTPITACEQYSDRGTCEADPYDVCTGTGELICPGEDIDARGVWIEENGVGSCRVETVHIDEAGSSLGSCVSSAVVLEDNCATSKTKKVRVTEVLNGNSACLDCTPGTYEKIIPCGRPVVELPFIGFWQIISIICILGIVYSTRELIKYRTTKRK